MISFGIIGNENAYKSTMWKVTYTLWIPTAESDMRVNTLSKSLKVCSLTHLPYTMKKKEKKNSCMYLSHELMLGGGGDVY
jgi:hypothetical protein